MAACMSPMSTLVTKSTSWIGTARRWLSRSSIPGPYTGNAPSIIRAAIDSVDNLHLMYANYLPGPGTFVLQYSTNVSGSWVTSTLVDHDVGVDIDFAVQGMKAQNNRPN